MKICLYMQISVSGAGSYLALQEYDKIDYE